MYNSKNKVVKKFTKKLKKGKASLIVPKKFYGKFSKAIIKYTGKDYKVKSFVEKKIVISPTVKIPKKMLQGEKKYVSIKLPGKKGVLKIFVGQIRNGKYKSNAYSKKLVRGNAKIALSKLKAGDYIHNIKFIETLKNGKKVSYNIYSKCRILKPLSIYAPDNYAESDFVDLDAYKSGGKALSGKFITIKINNKFFKKVKTDKYGYARFNIPNEYKSSNLKITAQYNKNIDTKIINYI